ncbi:MAG: ATP-binding protein [Verrucomicrobiota bacterium]
MPFVSNPFLYGCIVESGQYCPRPRLEKRLTSFIRNGQNVAILGPRRVGKSSLIHHAAAGIKGTTLLYADLWGVNTLNDFIRRCVQALDSIEDKASLFQKVARALPGLTMSMSVDPVTGAPSLTPTLEARKKPAPETVTQIAHLWASLDDGKHNTVIALDEFQDLADMEDAEQVLGLLRREIQLLGKIPFIFCGSIRNDMWQIFGDDRGPFYKSAAILEVSATDFQDWLGFLREKFESSNLKISNEVLSEIIQLADGNPGDTQQLCASVWEEARGSSKVITSSHVREALLQVFADEKKGYEHLVSDISGQQLAVLRAIALLGGESIQSGEFLATSGITHASSSKAAATRLVNRRILQETPEGLKFSNPFFRSWLLHVRY